jgi:hypothetical protein
MIVRTALCLAAAISLMPSGARAEGRLGTLEPGRYLCELPGDAAGLASVPLPDMWFDVVNASSYTAPAGSGTYLLTGETLVFTRGPMKGMKFTRIGARTLKVVDGAGERAKMRCVRTGRGAAA